MNADRIIATYLVETPLPIEQAAATLAGEQSSGTFVAVPGETNELRERFGARVESIEELEPTTQPSLPGCRGAKTGALFRRANLRVSWPVENVGSNLPALFSTLQGNLYELSQFSGLRLLDIDLPEAFTKTFRGPAFGVDGTRGLTNVTTGPLIGTIIKPSVGLSPTQTAAIVSELVAAGIDFIKDDELMTNPPHSPFNERVDAVMAVVSAHADRTGKKVMVAFNITDELDAMQNNYDRIVARRGTCAMISLNAVGLVATKKLCDRGQLAIHGHRNGFGMFTRHPTLGISFAAYEKYWRLAGVDQLHVNGIANKFWEPDDSVVASMQSLAKHVNNLKPLLPVVSSGQTGAQAPETFRRTNTTDLLYLAGGGIMAHPGGPGAGVRALRQAWEAAVSGTPLETYAATHPELAQSINKFAKKG